MSEERRLQQMFRYCLYAIAVLHLVCLVLTMYASRHPPVQAQSHFASAAPVASAALPSA